MNRFKEEVVALVAWLVPAVAIAIVGLLTGARPARDPAPILTKLDIGRIEEVVENPAERSEPVSQLQPDPNQQQREPEPANPADGNSLAIDSNPIEPAPRPNRELSQFEIERAVDRYRSALREGKTEIRIGTTSPFETFDWMGNKFALTSRNVTPSNGTQRVIVDQFGRSTNLISGGLMARVDRRRLPFDAEEIAMNLIGDHNVDAAVVLHSEIELELYRSLFNHLKPQGLTMPQANWTYEAIVGRVGGTGSLVFNWTERVSHNLGER